MLSYHVLVLLHQSPRTQQQHFHHRLWHALLIFHSAKCLDSPDEQLTSLAGTIGYVALEVLKNTGHRTPVIWATCIPCFSALAIITYMSLFSYPPFVRTAPPPSLTPKSNSRARTGTRFPIKPNPSSGVSPLLIRSTVHRQRGCTRSLACHHAVPC